MFLKQVISVHIYMYMKWFNIVCVFFGKYFLVLIWHIKLELWYDFGGFFFYWMMTRCRSIILPSTCVSGWLDKLRIGTSNGTYTTKQLNYEKIVSWLIIADQNMFVIIFDRINFYLMNYCIIQCPANTIVKFWPAKGHKIHFIK